VETVAIIGTGLIGGSIGLALKGAKLSDVEVVGFDEDRPSMGDARKMGAIDRTTPSAAEAVRGAKMVIVAVPPLAVRAVFEEIAGHLVEGAVLTDTTSTKTMASRWAKELMPEHVNFVGGHPMAGKENQGIKAAEATLFKDKAWAVVPSPNAGEGAVRSVLGLISIAGAEPLFVDPEEHDQYVAAISHLPLVMSAALFSLVRHSPSWDDIAPLAATGFKDMTRLASGEPRMAHDICATNGDAVAHWIDRYIVELQRYKDLLLEDRKQLFKVFSEAQIQRDAFLVGDFKTRQPMVETPSVKDSMSNMLLGGLLNSRMEKFEKDMDRQSKGKSRGVLDDDD
jgi:prephenate dehydrogenase